MEITVAITVKNYGRQLQWKIACVCRLAAGRESWTSESANQLLSNSGNSVFSFKNYGGVPSADIRLVTHFLKPDAKLL